MPLIRAAIGALAMAIVASPAAGQSMSGSVSPSILHFTVTPAPGGGHGAVTGDQAMQVSIDYSAPYSSNCNSVESIIIYRSAGLLITPLASKDLAPPNGVGMCAIHGTVLPVTPFTTSEVEACHSPLSTTLHVVLLHHKHAGDGAPAPAAGLINSALAAAGLGAGSYTAVANRDFPIQATVSCTPVHQATSAPSSASPSAAANQNLSVTLVPATLSLTSSSPGVIHGSQTTQLSASFPTLSTGCISVERINVYRGMHTPQVVLIAQKNMPQSNGAGPCGIFGTVIPVIPFQTSTLQACGAPSTMINVALLHREGTSGTSYDTVASKDVLARAVVTCAAGSGTTAGPVHGAAPASTPSQHAPPRVASASPVVSAPPARVASTPAAAAPAPATLTVTPEQYSGTCPVAFSVRGSYTSTATGPATSKWTFGDGGTTIRNVTLFNGANTMTMPLNIQASHSTTVTLAVTADGKTTTASAPYVIQCK